MRPEDRWRVPEGLVEAHPMTKLKVSTVEAKFRTVETQIVNCNTEVV